MRTEKYISLPRDPARFCRVVELTGWTLVAAAFLAVLYASYAGFTWGKWGTKDFTIYSNMIWDCGAGRPFHCLLDRNYLRTHLSFSLALLGPPYHLFNHPAFLYVVQISSLLGGAACLFAIARRHRLPSCFTAAVLFFFVAYPFTQSVMLSDFHGVVLYLVLLPWLHLSVVRRSGWVWLPLVLLLGLREDAFLYAMPILLYGAVRNRWRPGYIYLALALGYGLLAIFVLFPVINDVSLFARRNSEISGGAVAGALSLAGLRNRAWALLWVAAPLLLFLRRRAVPALGLIAVPLLVNLLSGSSYQYRLENHYPAALVAMMAIALLEAYDRTHCPDMPSRHRAAPAWGAVYLIAVTVAAHFSGGFLRGGPHHQREYGRIHDGGRLAMAAARHIPRDGVLLVPLELAAFCANRADIIPRRYYRPEDHRVDIVFCRLKHFHGGQGRLSEMLRSGEFGATYMDERFVIFEKGADGARDNEVLERIWRFERTLDLAGTLRYGGKNRTDERVRGVRYWRGDDEQTLVAYGKTLFLEPGTWHALFTLRAEGPDEADDAWGLLEIYSPCRDVMLAQDAIEPVRQPGYRVQEVVFQLSEPLAVEPRVMGHRARLWLDNVELQNRSTVARNSRSRGTGLID